MADEATIVVRLEDGGSDGAEPPAASPTPAAGKAQRGPLVAAPTTGKDRPGNSPTKGRTTDADGEDGRNPNVLGPLLGKVPGPAGQVLAKVPDSALPPGMTAGLAKAAGAIAAAGSALLLLSKAAMFSRDQLTLFAVKAGGLSGAVASANANAQVAKLNADIRNAKEFGPAAARAVERKTENEILAERLKLELAEELEPLAATLAKLEYIGLEIALSVVKTANAAIVLSADLKSAAGVIVGQQGDALKLGAALLDQVKNVLPQPLGPPAPPREPIKAEGPLGEMLDLIDPRRQPGRPQAPQRPAAAPLGGVVPRN